MSIHFKLALIAFLISNALISQINFEALTFEETLAKAQKEGKKVFVDVYTTWCGPCKSMDANIFSDKKVGERMAKEYICLKVDYEKSPDRSAISKYYIKGYPTMLILSPNGMELGRIYGSRSLTVFNQELDSYKDKLNHPMIIAFEAMKDNPNDQTIWKKSLGIIGGDYNLMNSHNLYYPYLDSCKRYFEKFDIQKIEDQEDLSIFRQVPLPVSHAAVQYYINDSLDFGSYMHFDYSKASFREKNKNAKTKSEIEDLKSVAKKYHEQVFLGMGGDLEGSDYFMNDLFSEVDSKPIEEVSVIEEKTNEGKPIKKKKGKKEKAK